jgi:hypothetical protein
MEHKTGRIQFEAAPPGQLRALFDLLWGDIGHLIKTTLAVDEVFYCASFTHWRL